MADSAPSERLRSCLCTQAQLESGTFQAWAARIREKPMRMHRKIWEYCYIAQALHERGMLGPSRRGLGFAVGREPLSALFASLGCEILATDLATDEAREAKWVETGQHADSLDALNDRGICEPGLFRQRVRFRFVDMRCPPEDLGQYDFVWSCCALEHLGTLAAGERFILDSLRYLRPGGVGIHTTEFNLSSNFFTIRRGTSVVFRRRDIERIAAKLRKRGCRITLDFAEGRQPCDLAVDTPPYKQEVHLRLLLGRYTVTSFGLILET